MSVIAAEEATTFFDALPDALRFAHFSPEYIKADAARDAGLSPVFFLYSRGDSFFYHGFHLAKTPLDDFNDIQSPYGYGGPLMQGDSAFIREAWDAYVAWCRTQRVLAEFIRFHPGVENHRSYPGEIFFDRVTVWIDPAEDDVFTEYQTRARTDIRKALKEGLRMELVEPQVFLSHFRPMYAATMKKASASDFYYFNNVYFDRLSRLDALWMLLFKTQTPVGGAIFLTSGINMEYCLSATTEEGRALRAGSLLLHHAKMLGKERGCRYFNLGGGSDRLLDNKVLFFKKSFSNAQADFYIGKHIFFEQEYAECRRVWEAQNGTAAPKILFYR